MLYVSLRKYFLFLVWIFFVIVMVACSSNSTGVSPSQTSTTPASEIVETTGSNPAINTPPSPTAIVESSQPANSTPVGDSQPAPLETPVQDQPIVDGSGNGSYPQPPENGQGFQDENQDSETPNPYPSIVDTIAITPIPTQLTQTLVQTQTFSVTATITPNILILTKLTASDPSSVRLASGQTQLIQFFAYWDPMSKSMAPVLHKLAVIYQNRIRFVFLDVDDPKNEEVKKTLGYKNPPQLFLVDGGGNIIVEWQGFVGEETLISAFSLVP
jgi:thiol-disulfide isomerase/thioredoxin